MLIEQNRPLASNSQLQNGSKNGLYKNIKPN